MGPVVPVYTHDFNLQSMFENNILPHLPKANELKGRDLVLSDPPGGHQYNIHHIRALFEPISDCDQLSDGQSWKFLFSQDIISKHSTWPQQQYPLDRRRGDISRLLGYRGRLDNNRRWCRPGPWLYLSAGDTSRNNRAPPQGFPLPPITFSVNRKGKTTVVSFL